MSPAAHGVIQRLDAARQKWWLFTLLSTAVLAMCASLGAFVLCMALDALVRFPQWLLAGVLAAWLGLTIYLLVMLCRRLMRGQRSLEATARCVEAELPELGSDLINVVQLSSDTKNENRGFCEAAVSEAAGRLRQIRFEEAAAKETRWRRFRYCLQTPRDFGESVVALVVLVALALVCQLLMPNWGSAANRLMTPWKFVPSVGKVRIVAVRPGNTEVMVGAGLDVEAEVEMAPAAKRAYKATMFVTSEGEKKETAMLMAVDKTLTKYTLNIPAVLKPLKYRLEIGDSQSDVYNVGLVEKPAISEIQVSFIYPTYLGKTKDTFSQKQGDLEAPQYTVAELAVRPTVPIAKGHVEVDGARFIGHVDSTGALVVKFPLLKDGTYTIRVFDSLGHTDPDPRVNRIHVLTDQPPTVELLKPERDSTAAPGASIPVTIRAGDDHVLGRVRLEMRARKTEGGTSDAAPAKDEPREKAAGESEHKAAGPQDEPADLVPLTTVQEWTTFDGKTTALLQHRLELPAGKIKDGDTVLVRAVAWDTRDISDWGLDLKPQQTASAWASIRVVAEEKKVAATLEQLDGLRASIRKILEMQFGARNRTVKIPLEKEVAKATATAGEVRQTQTDVQKSSIDLVKTIPAKDTDERAAIKRVLNQLAFNEMLEAVQQCEELVKLNQMPAFAQSVPKLNKLQDRIIETLERILDATRKAQAEALSEMKKRPGGNLPDDEKKKFQEDKKKLDKLLEQQKKVIEASENLAKKPVENFSEKDEQLIKKLAAAEDDLAKFMKELQTDLSKLPDQDFANASQAKEANEIQTELKLAEDALLKKATDIAVPLEQLGYEKAEALSSNMEKWLPDTADREKWNQEEALSDKDKHAPMAELPSELEDLIGDLAEQEEDLMDEAQEISSSAIDSADKGVGWDATDGPISNNSAKGVTGNRLPSGQEIGGRSGEGRSAKSSGEFVGDEAVGKGGRKTPSRLTPDPIMKGQIKDHDTSSQGGATGGGKESGEGGEGLEGPQPGGHGKRDHNRLAGKQAALRNKAQGVDLQHFKVTGYHHQDLEKMIDVMKQVEDDLKAGRYQNALRERKVLLDGLGNVKQYLKGDFEVKKDASVNLPTGIQKDILGAMQDPSPAGWEDFNRQYFEALSNGEATQADAAPAKPASGQAEHHAKE
jgi:hypothetical protein